MKTKIFIFLTVLFSLSVPSCSDADPSSELGTIVFTATHDCDIRLFDINGNQIAREQYELGKTPAIIRMKSSGVFIVHAVSENKPTYKEPITYKNGHLDYYIEF